MLWQKDLGKKSDLFGCRKLKVGSLLISGFILPLLNLFIPNIVLRSSNFKNNDTTNKSYKGIRQ